MNPPNLTTNNNNNNKPFVRILEQPAKCAIRFRYECEGRSAGSIPGVNSTAENKSFPTIQVCNYRGKAVVVVSCVTKDSPHRPHPHNLVGKEGCKKGVCTIVIDNSVEMACSFTSLGIQCVKRKDIEESLKLRELIKVDPFRTGFNHRTQASSIDLNVVRLCFQVFIEGPDKGKFTVQLPPVVSEPIYDKKAMAELIIIKLSHYSAPCTGGKEIILLCDRVAKDDIQVRFFQESSGQGLVWEAYADFLPNDVHKQVAISLRTPKYFDESISQPVTVQIQLRRPSDGCVSQSRNFQLTPGELDPDGLVRKRHKRIKEENYDLLQEYIQLANTSFAAPTATESSSVISQPASVSPSQVPIPIKQLSSSPSSTRSPFVAPSFHQTPKHESTSGSKMVAATAGTSQPAYQLYSHIKNEPLSTDYPKFPLDGQLATYQVMANSPQYRTSPNPSISSYASPVPSPATNQVNNFQEPQELPHEVMERFDSLDIDSSELIQDLDLNSNTILNLMMDTSSGLSLSDSFSDITNNNNNPNNPNVYETMANSRGGSRIKLNTTTASLNENPVSELLDTPTIEITNVSFNCGNHPVANDPLLSVLDVDNNNRIN